MSPRKTTKKSEFKLPRYLKLNKGSMFFDDDPNDNNASGIRLFAINKVLVGRSVKNTGEVNEKDQLIMEYGGVVHDKNKNKDLVDYGYIDQQLPWYVDTKDIQPTKLSRIIKAYQNGILIEATKDSLEIKKEEIKDTTKDFKLNDRGDRVFIGTNKAMYTKLQNMGFKSLRDFVNTCPKTRNARDNLMDLYHYEQRGYNPLSRPRLEVLDLIKAKLQEFGSGISAIRMNED